MFTALSDINISLNIISNSLSLYKKLQNIIGIALHYNHNPLTSHFLCNLDLFLARHKLLAALTNHKYIHVEVNLFAEQVYKKNRISLNYLKTLN